MAKSGMDYTQMDSLIKNIELTYAKNIHDALTENVGTIIENIRAAYSGEAADQYKKKFNETATNIDTTMADIITKLKNNFDAEKQAYEQQEKKMKESIQEEVQ